MWTIQPSEREAIMGFDSKQTAAAHTGPAPTERMMQAIVQDRYGSADVLRPAQIERPRVNVILA